MHKIRPARPEEAQALTELARASKASWGYSAEMQEQFKDELTITAAEIIEDTVAVCVSGDEILGFYRLCISSEDSELGELFVSPDLKRSGIGRVLTENCFAAAAQAGAVRMKVQSDPYAQGFYEAMGFVKTGQSESDSIPGRYLPMLEKKL